MSPPKYKPGADWQGFVAEFEEMSRLADLTREQQLTYLKQCLPDEGRRLLSNHQVMTMRGAYDLLGELYEPVRDSWTMLEEVKAITQRPGERLRALAGRIRHAAERYGQAMRIASGDLEKMIQDRFRYALMNEETRNHLLWDSGPMTVDDMVRKAQTFEDRKQSTPKKALRTVDDDTKNLVEQLKRKVEQLETELKQSKTDSRRSQQRSQPLQRDFVCWNCGRKDHMARECPKPKKGNGFTHKPSSQRGKEVSPKTPARRRNQETSTVESRGTQPEKSPLN